MSWGTTIRTKKEIVLENHDGEPVAVFDSQEVADQVAVLLNADDAAQRKAARDAKEAASAKGKAVVVPIGDDYQIVIEGGFVDGAVLSQVSGPGAEEQAKAFAATYNDG